jgi:hypothetical protein
VVVAEAEEEPRFGDEAPPALAHEGRAGERRGARRHAEKDLAEEIVVVQGRAAAAAAGRLLVVAHAGWINWGVEGSRSCSSRRSCVLYEKKSTLHW